MERLADQTKSLVCVIGNLMNVEVSSKTDVLITNGDYNRIQKQSFDTEELYL